jgi:modulator of FtsH protease
MNDAYSPQASRNPAQYPENFSDHSVSHQELNTAEVKRVLRNTYALLSLTLLFSAAVAGHRRGPAPARTGPHPHAGGLLSVCCSWSTRYRTAAGPWAPCLRSPASWATPWGPCCRRTHWPCRVAAQTIALALGATGATFLALSGWVLATRRDFSFMGGFLFAGMVIRHPGGLAAMFFQIPAHWVWRCRPWWPCCRPV